jgi:hypothetical protein
LPDNDVGTIRLLTRRAGTVAEIRKFLRDLEGAYAALYSFDARLGAIDDRDRPGLYPSRRWYAAETRWSWGRGSREQEVLPEHRLTITRIQIESPGFWEILGALNPLQQIREYLNDRHKRIQDRKFREAREQERLRLENELIQRQIWEKENAILHDRVVILRDLGFSNEELRRLVWTDVGAPLARLGSQQDSGLVDGAE